MLNEGLFSVCSKIALGKMKPRFVEHRGICGGCGGYQGCEVQSGVMVAPVNCPENWSGNNGEYRFHVGYCVDLLIPGIDISVRENHFGFRVCLDQFFGKYHCQKISHCLTVSQQLIPMFSIKGARLMTLVGIFSSQSTKPQVIVGRVVKGAVHMIYVVQT